MLFQVRLKLRPLHSLREQLAEVRAGASVCRSTNRSRLCRWWGEINGSLDQNVTNLEHARRHAANRAHGLKTPLATPSMVFGETGSIRDKKLASLVEGMDRRIRHHLRRARAAAMGGSVRARVELAGVIDDLVMVLWRMHADKAITFDTDVSAGLVLPCDRQDIEEMLGNLIENACRWCAGRVRVSASREDSFVLILIEDDGPGLAAEDRSAVLQCGRRLDESEPGHGFGLPIALELAKLYGGSLVLEASLLGGLAVRLSLPG